jgi:hypothetical protein
MTVTYIKQFKDDDGEVTHEQVADGEIRAMNHQIEMLRAALEIEKQAVADLRELLGAVRKLAYDITDQTFKDKG